MKTYQVLLSSGRMLAVDAASVRHENGMIEFRDDSNEVVSIVSAAQMYAVFQDLVRLETVPAMV